MIQIHKKEQCCGCRACEQSCPHKCIEMKKDEEGFLYPKINLERCIHCNMCGKVCPIINVKSGQSENLKALAAYNLDEKCRLESSSGGIFTLLANQVLLEDGVVCGVVMSAGCNTAYHKLIERKEDLLELRGSKYLQSDTLDVYTRIKQALVKNKKVLFTGTPCQVEGLKCFIGRDYENLLCVDFVCHGVPSPLLWRKYVSHRKKLDKAPLLKTSFRHKKYGWKMYTVLFEYSNNTVYVETVGRNPYMRMFLQNLCLRPSCYACEFKNMQHVSDLTIADFWGCDDICPDLNDNKGLSLIVVQSEKGKILLNAIENQMVIREVDIHKAVKNNSAMLESSKKPIKRDEFMNDLQYKEFIDLEKKYIWDNSIKGIIKRFIPKAVKNAIKRNK